MNCKINISAATNISCQSELSLFCKVYQSLFANFEIGETSIRKGQTIFEWNENFECQNTLQELSIYRSS